MCFTLQRYKIESNSQLRERQPIDWNCCVSHCKDTKLKAIHNTSALLEQHKMLCFTLQRYKIESNSQLRYVCKSYCSSCVSHCKDTKLKAIHNSKSCKDIVNAVVFHTAKIQNWKQFTTLNRHRKKNYRCVSHCKDTKLKAIHNSISAS